MMKCNTKEGFLMYEKVSPSDLVGTHEIAERIGRAFPSIVRAWKRRHKDFPKPIATLSMGNIWNWKEVEDWAIRTKRLEKDQTPLTYDV